jgi:hypothetical protein
MFWIHDFCTSKVGDFKDLSFWVDKNVSRDKIAMDDILTSQMRETRE